MPRYIFAFTISISLLASFARADDWPRKEPGASNPAADHAAAPAAPAADPGLPENDTGPAIVVAPNQHPVTPDPLPPASSDWVQREHQQGVIRIPIGPHPIDNTFRWPNKNVCQVGIPFGLDSVRETRSNCDPGNECPYAKYDVVAPSMHPGLAYFVSCVPNSNEQLTNASWTDSTLFHKEYNAFDFGGQHFFVEALKQCKNCTVEDYKVYPASTSTNGDENLIIRAARAWRRFQADGVRTTPYKSSNFLGHISESEVISNYWTRPEIYPKPSSSLTVVWNGNHPLSDEGPLTDN
jgi:hypothetical protein